MEEELNHLDAATLKSDARTQHKSVVIPEKGRYQQIAAEREAVLAALAVGEADIAAERTVSAAEARESIRARYIHYHPRAA